VIFTVRNESAKCDIEHIHSTMRKGRVIKYRKGRVIKIPLGWPYTVTTIWSKGLRAGWFCFAGRIRPADRRLPTPALQSSLLPPPKFNVDKALPVVTPLWFVGQNKSKFVNNEVKILSFSVKKLGAPVVCRSK